MDKLIAHSHDSLFKLFMQDKDVANEFMELYLPPEIKAISDLTTLRLESGSFVEPSLKQKFNDILYSVNTKQGKGYIYCLIEMQSKPDRTIAFRMMEYAIMAMRIHLKKGHKKLLLVVPLLFYCGAKPHPKSIPLNWVDHFDEPKSAIHLYTTQFTLIDVSQSDDDELKRHKRLGILEYLFKNIQNRDFMQLLEQINQFLIPGLHSQDLVDGVLFYLYNNSNIDDPQKLAEQLQHSPNQYQENIMNFAQYLKQTGLEEGRQEGLQIDEQKGSHDTTLAIAKNMLINGIDIELIQKITGLSEDEIRQLTN